MKNLFLVVFSFLAVFVASAKPAKPGLLKLVQPDGTVLYATINGDEYGKLLVSKDGYALTKDADGYYSYAWYDDNGLKHSSCCHYGRPTTQEILMKSAAIPYDLLEEKALQSRLAHRLERPLVLKTKATSGNKVSAIVILMQFPDLKFKYSTKYFDSLLDRAKLYFNDQFGHKVDFEFVIAPVVTVPESYAYYGKNGKDDFDAKASEAVVEACRLLDDNVDFSKFDNDGDGTVDNVFLFYAGPDEAEGAGDDYLWSHSWDIEYGGYHLALDGVRIKNYALTSELIYYSNGTTEFNGIGPFCHEFGHLLGLPDFYDTDYEDSGGDTNGLWGFTSLMDKGSYNDECQTPPNFNAIEREMLGLGTGLPMKEGLCRLAPVNEGNNFYRMETGHKDNYYLIEYRKSSGWDQFIGGSGILVYHVNKSEEPAGYSHTYKRELSASERWRYNEINCNPGYMCAEIVPALTPYTPSDVSSIFYPGVNGKYTTCKPYEESFYSLTNISRSDDEASFMVIGSLYMDDLDIYQDAAILNWHLDESQTIAPAATVTISSKNATIRTIEVPSFSGGEYSCTIDGLDPATEYELKVEVVLADGSVARFSADFMTVRTYEDSYTAINLNKAERYPSGAFKKGARLPLRLNNAINASSVEWKFNGRTISVNPQTGYYELDGSGTLSVEYVRADGTRETIIKEISVK